MPQVTSPTLGITLGTTTTGTTTNGEGAKFALGTTVNGTDGQRWMYVQANGAITQYDAVAIDEDFQAAALTKTLADTGLEIGFAQVAFADNEFGWVAMAGSNINLRTAAASVVDSALYTSTTAGVLSSTTNTSGTKIDGVVAVVSAGTQITTVEIIATYPRSGTF